MQVSSDEKCQGNGVQCSLSDNKSDTLVDRPPESPHEHGYGWSGSLDSDPPSELSHSQLAGGGRPGGRTLPAPPFTPTPLIFPPSSNTQMACLTLQ